MSPLDAISTLPRPLFRIPRRSRVLRPSKATTQNARRSRRPSIICCTSSTSLTITTSMDMVRVPDQFYYAVVNLSLFWFIDGLLTPTDGTPEKKSFLVKRASFVGSLRTASSKRKSTAPGDDVPTLGYKASPASSSSSSLEDDHSSSGASSKSGQEEKAVVAASSQGIKSSRYA